MRGKDSDRSALAAYRARLNPVRGRYRAAVYSVRIPISVEAVDRPGGVPNLGNLWYLSHGKRGGMRRRYEPYRDTANGPWEE